VDDTPVEKKAAVYQQNHTVKEKANKSLEAFPFFD